MEFLTANLASGIRRETLFGRDYLVGRGTALVEGVLEGSEGPLFYPKKEIARNPEDWNGMPVILRHPMKDGKPTSARQASVYNSDWLGWVFNSTYEGKLNHDYWFEEESTRRLSPETYAKLVGGQPIELSTGLFTQNTPVQNDGSNVHKGKTYTHVARRYRPDHVAILPDQKGACSVADGCGVNVNARKPSAGISREKACQILHDKQARGHPLTDRQRRMFAARCKGGGKKKPTGNAVLTANSENVMNREEKIAHLTTNCACWKGENAAEVLNASDDAFIDHQLAMASAAGLDAEIRDAFGLSEDVPTESVVNAAVKAALKKRKKAPEGEPPAANARAKRLVDFLETEASEEDRQVWNGLVEFQKRESARLASERKQLATDLLSVANSSGDPRLKATVARRVESDSVDDLRDYLLILSAAAGRKPVERPYGYFGAGGIPVANQEKDDSDNILPVVNVDFTEFAADSLRRKKA